MARYCRYEAQLAETARLVAEAAGAGDYRLAYQSRSGPAEAPWLEPDIRESLRQLARLGTRDVVVSPIGFLSDHMEVVYDLDVDAAAAAARLGIRFVRARTAGTAPRFVETVCDLVLERLENRPPVWVGRLGPRPVPCAASCCPPAAVSAARPTRPSG
jgi:ferrochelatase